MRSGITGKLAGLATFAALSTGMAALAQEAEIPSASDVSAYVDNTYLFLVGGLIVMFMSAGFCMLEAGLVRSKNAATQVTKNIALYSIAGLMFWLVGYNLLYPGDGNWLVEGYIGAFAPWETADDLGTGYSSGSDHFFQMVFVAATASIVSGTVAERIKLWPFLIFTAVLTGIIYPIQCSWQWGGGFLSAAGFSDFAGSTLVHSTGGWAALVGAIILGPRLGKYVDGRVVPMPGSNIPLAALGTFILWFGWFGFNGGSQLAAGTFDDINAVSTIFLNTNLAAAAGTVAAMILTTILYKKTDATMAFNGALGGLVSITAGPLDPSFPVAILIGAIGGVLVVLTIPLLDKFKIDDVVGAIPVHLVCGIWGTMIVPLSTEGTSFAVQALGVVSVGAFVSAASAIVWIILKVTMGLRVSEEEEMEGLDLNETGVAAYPDFNKQH
ncbi:ammonium transporter [Hirschia maritima]|uniref:ammonium transporter n=1 Tax=Hirschia maritima TaxID=1121961 RepID=UPI00035E787A|nr:ammonium transporter [Hirschia maritima]